MKKCLDLSIFGYSATNQTPNQTPYQPIPDNELFMLSYKWLSFNANDTDIIEYEIQQNITKDNHSERLLNILSPTNLVDSARSITIYSNLSNRQ
jgi:hypothetical protein